LTVVIGGGGFDHKNILSKKPMMKLVIRPWYMGSGVDGRRSWRYSRVPYCLRKGRGATLTYKGRGELQAGL